MFNVVSISVYVCVRIFNLNLLMLVFLNVCILLDTFYILSKPKKVPDGLTMMFFFSVYTFFDENRPDCIKIKNGFVRESGTDGTLFKGYFDKIKQKDICINKTLKNTEKTVIFRISQYQNFNEFLIF